MRTRDFLSILVIFSLILGCSHKPPGKKPPEKIQTPLLRAFIAPKPPEPAESALGEIKKQYRAEFDEMAFPRPGKEPSLGATAMKCKGFPKTLRAIGDFERRYGTKSPEGAHLTILKGMIHLQSGRFRSASAIEPEIVKAAELLSNSADSKGNEVLARNFRPLVTGWRDIHKHEQNLRAQNAGKPFPFASVDFKKVQFSADQIYEKLRSNAAEYPEIVQDPESDVAGLYVAAVAATFYAWVQKSNDRNCRNSDECTPKRRENKEEAVFYKKGRDLIGLFLTEGEKNSVLRGHHMNQGITTCHLRYLSWYGWLSQKVDEASRRSHKKGIASRQ